MYKIIKIYTPRGIRIPVTSVKGRCPRPLDDGGLKKLTRILYTIYSYLSRQDMSTTCLK